MYLEGTHVPAKAVSEGPEGLSSDGKRAKWGSNVPKTRQRGGRSRVR